MIVLFKDNFLLLILIFSISLTYGSDTEVEERVGKIKNVQERRPPGTPFPKRKNQFLRTQSFYGKDFNKNKKNEANKEYVEKRPISRHLSFFDIKKRLNYSELDKLEKDGSNGLSYIVKQGSYETLVAIIHSNSEEELKKLYIIDNNGLSVFHHAALGGVLTLFKLLLIKDTDTYYDETEINKLPSKKFIPFIKKHLDEIILASSQGNIFELAKQGVTRSGNDDLYQFLKRKINLEKIMKEEGKEFLDYRTENSFETVFSSSDDSFDEDTLPPSQKAKKRFHKNTSKKCLIQ